MTRRRSHLACANVDARASREVAELKEIHDYRFESEVYEVSGQTLALSAMPRLLWLAHHRPDIYRKAATITCWDAKRSLLPCAGTRMPGR